MRMSRGWTGLRTAAIALGLLAWNAPRADAAAATSTPNLLDYSVSGGITATGSSSVTGITGMNVISYVPVTNVMIDPTSNIPLGSFQVAQLPVGQETIYNNTPFTLTFNPISLSSNGTTIPYANASSTDSGITVTGTLNGIVNGPYQSSVQVGNLAVSYGSPSQTGFELSPGSSSTLSLLPTDQKLLVPSSAGGITTIEGQITTTGLETAAPEPSTIALFLSTVCGLGLRRYVQGRRQKVHA